MLIVQALGRLRQETHKLEPRMFYVVKVCLNNKEINNNKRMMMGHLTKVVLTNMHLGEKLK